MPSHPYISQLPPTAGISDPQVRQFLDAVSSMLSVRNGDIPTAEQQRFVTLSEIGSLTKSALAGIFNSRGGPGNPENPGETGPNAGIIDALAEEIMRSELFRRLGQRIDRLSVPWDMLDNMNSIVSRLTEGLDIASNDVTRLTIVSNSVVTDVLALNTTVNGHTSDILQLFQTTENTATAVTQLDVRTTTAEGKITEISQVVLDPSYVSSTSLFGLIASMGNVTRTFWQSNPPSGMSLSPGDQWFDTDFTPPKHYYWDSAWIEGWRPLSDFSFAGITDERTARVARDTAMATAINNVWAMLGGAAAQIQEGSFADASHFTSGATKWDSVYAAVISPSGANLVAAVRTDLDAEIDRVTGMSRATYTVRVEAGPEGRTVVGGFGIMAEYQDGASVIDFIVRADRFAICTGVENGGDQTVETPFMALTTQQTIDGVLYEPGVYIRNAVIGRASIDVLQLAGEAVTVPLGSVGGSVTCTGSFQTITSVSHTPSVDVRARPKAYQFSGAVYFKNNGGGGADDVHVALVQNGVEVCAFAASIDNGYSISVPVAFHSAADVNNVAAYTWELKVRKGSSSSEIVAVVGSLSVMGVKR